MITLIRSWFVPDIISYSALIVVGIFVEFASEYPLYYCYKIGEDHLTVGYCESLGQIQDTVIVFSSGTQCRLQISKGERQESYKVISTLTSKLESVILVSQG
jgi:hypothetical protein